MIGVLSATPNLLMILVVSIGFMQGKTEGLFTGFAAGAFVDVIYGQYLGLYALLYLLAGYFCGTFTDVFFDEDIKVPLILVTICDAAFGVAVYIVGFLMRGRTDFGGYLVSVILPELVSTVVFMLLLYRLIAKINHRLVEKEKRGRHSLWIKD